MVEEHNFLPPGGVYNQASLLMLRLNDLFRTIDIASMNPLLEIYPNYYNYNSIANNLNSVYKAISGKLTDKEKDEMEEKIEEIENYILTNPPCGNKRDHLCRKRKSICFTAWKELNKLLGKFRRRIEELMEKYKLGNPSKRDPSTSIVD